MSEPCLLTKRAQRGTGASAVDGVLMMSASSVRWQPNDPSKGQPSLVDIAAITKIQQAPGKPFVKLDTAAGPLVLCFESLSDRDDAVELLKQFRPAGAGSGAAAGGAAAAGKGGSPGSGGGGEKLLLPTAAQAAAMFRSDKDLESVYKSLVVSGILSEAEFWRTRQAQLRDALAAGGGGGGGAARVRQRVGLPSAMLADVKPSADGQTEKVHFQLTPQIVRQIFTERPEVHRAYLAHVPGTMDEKAFWTRYFKQQYRRMAQRRKAGLVGAAADDDDDDELFAPFKKQLHEQEAQRAQQAVRRVDPTVNLAADAGERLSAGGGFGSLRDAGSDPAAAMRRAHLDTIARDINRHAAVVLQGTPEGLADLDGSGSATADGLAAKKGQDSDTARIAQALAEQQKRAAAAAAGSSAAASGSGGGGGKDDSVSPERLAEWQERAASALEDLTLDEREKQYAPLNIQDPRAYFDAATAAGGAADGKPASGKQEPAAAAGGPAAALAAALAAVQPLALPDPPCDPGLASDVLLELSQDQDEALVAEFGPVAATALQYPPHDRTHGLPAVLLEHLRGEALKTNELLRHLWGALPLVSAARADKAAKLARHLGEQRALLRSHMEAHPGTLQQVYVSMMLRPLAAAIDAALARYQQEQQARQRQQAAKVPP